LTASLKCHGTPDTDIALEVPPAWDQGLIPLDAGTNTDGTSW
jgi:hypothetical protein